MLQLSLLNEHNPVRVNIVGYVPTPLIQPTGHDCMHAQGSGNYRAEREVFQLGWQPCA